jgi:hypothetical protein
MLLSLPKLFLGEDTGSDDSASMDSPGHTLQYTTSAISAVKVGEKK